MICTILGDFARVLYQQSTDDNTMPEAAIVVSTHRSGVILTLTQEGREIHVDRESVRELCKVLREAERAMAVQS